MTSSTNLFQNALLNTLKLVMTTLSEAFLPAPMAQSLPHQLFTLWSPVFCILEVGMGGLMPSSFWLLRRSWRVYSELLHSNKLTLFAGLFPGQVRDENNYFITASTCQTTM